MELNNLMKISTGILVSGLAMNACTNAEKEKPDIPSQPNIVILYADDIGYGDLSCYGAVGVETPNLDRLAQKGVMFTDAHCAAATCTPSRYSLLTGKHPFRGNARVLPADAPLLINTEEPTLPALLKKAGYKTAAIGKWHLGVGSGDVNWNQRVKPGPLEIGFDYSFIIPATNDRVPSVYLENHHVVGLNPANPLIIKSTNDPSQHNPFDNPTGYTHPHLAKQTGDLQHSGVIVNGIPRIGFMGGGEEAWFRDEDFPYIFCEKAEEFIDNNDNDPFFLFFAFNEIHVPRVPDQKFSGKSTMGVRGDAIAQMDWMVGEIINTLKERGLLENTLVIFSSDNGPVLNDGYEDGAVELLGDHKPAGPFRGGKYSIFEGGHRVPAIACWPGVVPEGKISEAVWSQTDFIASFASLAGYEIPPSGAIDSEDMLSTLLGRSDKGKEMLFSQAFTFALRIDNWKYIEPSNNGNEWIWDTKKIEGGLNPDHQLYNLALDPGERNNLAEMYPEKATKMKALLDSIKNVY